MNNIVRLMESVYSAYNNATPGKEWAPAADGRTFCNEAVNHVAVLNGYILFARPTKDRPTGAALANHIYEMLANPKNGWLAVTGEVAQAHANEGDLVIAAQQSNGHGHVCVVIPGEMEDSGSWAKKAPKVLNVGKSVFVGKRASHAFSSEPEFFVLATA